MISQIDTATDTLESVSAFRQRVHEWLNHVQLPQLPADYNQHAAIMREWHRELYRAGFVGIQWPREVGGLGLTVDHQIAFNTELAQARAPQPVGSIGLEVVGPTILRYGTSQQRARFVPPLLAGDEVWCQGFSEPNAGSDLASLRTSAVIEGSDLVITGQKIWTSWATHADWCALLVRTNSDEKAHRGISYVLVDMRTPGVTVKPIAMLNGDAEFNELFFDGARVPLTNVLGELNGGWSLAMDTLGWERAGYSIRRRIENEAFFRSVLARTQAQGAAASSDQTATEFGVVYAKLKAFEALSNRTAQRLASGDVPSPMDSVDKLLLTETEQSLTALAFDLLGARRMAPIDDEAETDIKRFLYGRAASVYGGSSQIQKTLIAERLLDLPRGR